MKYFALALLIFSISCKKGDAVNEIKTTAKIIRDCTGTYLRVNNTDYMVCNTETTDRFDANKTVTVKFLIVTNCGGPSQVITCDLFHKYKSTVIVGTIQ